MYVYGCLGFQPLAAAWLGTDLNLFRLGFWMLWSLISCFCLSFREIRLQWQAVGKSCFCVSDNSKQECGHRQQDFHCAYDMGLKNLLPLLLVAFQNLKVSPYHWRFHVLWIENLEELSWIWPGSLYLKDSMLKDAMQTVNSSTVPPRTMTTRTSPEVK